MTETPFRIGGVYRNREGMLIRLSPEGAIGQTGIDLAREAYANRINEDGTPTTYGCGICSLVTGRMGDDKDTYADLVTGELHQINGEWVPRGVPVEAPATDWVRRARERVAQKRAADPTYERTRPALTWADSKRVDRFPGFVVERGAVKHDEYNPPERVLHPLQRITQEGDQLHGSAFLRKVA
jgi:hypothetical protein